MKKFFLTISIVATALMPAVAQNDLSSNTEANKPVTLPLEGGRPVVDAQPAVTIAYFSYQKALQLMPDYAATEKNMQKLQAQYDGELSSAERDFTEKYELFLEQQSTMAAPIREKRQADLQALYDSNVKFRAESQRLLAKARQEAFAPLEEKLKAAVAEVGRQGNYIMVVNTDSNVCPYLDPARSEDVTAKIIDAAKK